MSSPSEHPPITRMTLSADVCEAEAAAVPVPASSGRDEHMQSGAYATETRRHSADVMKVENTVKPAEVRV
jgi:hypothetical protein